MRLIKKWQDTFKKYSQLRKKGIKDFSVLLSRAEESCAYYRNEHTAGYDELREILRHIPLDVRGYMVFGKIKKTAKNIIQLRRN